MNKIESKYGISARWDYESDDVLVATFDSEKDAEKYISDSEDKSDFGSRFKQDTLLRDYEGHQVCVVIVEVVVPHNPTV